MRECDQCDGSGIIWVPVGEFGQVPDRCWKCDGLGRLDPQPMVSEDDRA